MKKLITCFLVLGCLVVGAQPSNTAESEAFYNKAMPVIKPTYKSQILQSAAALRNKTINADSLAAAYRKTPLFGNLAEGDIMALCFLVMMEASKSAQEDLKGIMSNVKAINQKKETIRSQSATTGTQKLSQTDLKRQTDSLKNQLDRLDDINNEEQIRLQIMMDRKEKAQQMMLNLMKKIRDTQDAIISNLK